MAKVAPDVPQKILDIFNKVDYARITAIIRIPLMMQIRSWVGSNMPPKDPNVVYKAATGSPKKVVAKDIDEELLSILNNVDYAKVSKEKMTEVIAFLKTYITKLPQKK